MSRSFPVSQSNLVNQLKLSLKVPEVVEAFVARSIISSAAVQANIQVEATELQEAADAFRLKNNLTTAAETLAWLQKYRLSVDDFEDLIYARLLAAKLAIHLFESQVESFYLEHRSEYVKVVLYEVVLPNEDLAIELFYALQEQETTFDEVVRNYASDVRSRRRRGYRGVLRRAELPPELAEPVFAAEPPQVLQPVALRDQFHLLFVEERIEPELDESMRQKITQQLFSRWVRDQLTRAEIRYEF